MGHNFGLTHDTDTCGCPDDRCIMAPSSGSVFITPRSVLTTTVNPLIQSKLIRFTIISGLVCVCTDWTDFMFSGLALICFYLSCLFLNFLFWPRLVRVSCYSSVFEPALSIVIWVLVWPVVLYHGCQQWVCIYYPLVYISAISQTVCLCGPCVYIIIWRSLFLIFMWVYGRGLQSPARRPNPTRELRQSSL